MISNIYQGNYKRLIIPPLILLILAAIYIPQIKLGVDFKGGTLITLVSNQAISDVQLKANLKQERIDATVQVFQTPVGYKTEIEIGQSEQLLKADELKGEFYSKIGLLESLEQNASNNTEIVPIYLEKRKEVNAIVNQLFELSKENKDAATIGNLNLLRKEADRAYANAYISYRDSIGKIIDKYIKYQSISVQSVSPTLQKRFIEKAEQVIIYSAILSIIFVTIMFRKIIPAVAILTGAACDVFIALGAMGLFGIPFSLPSFAALLMLIGFSLDTDILLTKKMLSGTPGTAREHAWDALQTGTTMSIAGIVSFVVLFLIAQAMRITTYYDISAVALAGLIGDLFATWGINAVTMLWYVEKNEHK